MTQETDVQRILSAECTVCGAKLNAQRWCEPCITAGLSKRMHNVSTNIQQKIQFVQNYMQQHAHDPDSQKSLQSIIDTLKEK
jgi:hypothetical protein